MRLLEFVPTFPAAPSAPLQAALASHLKLQLSQWTSLPDIQILRTSAAPHTRATTSPPPAPTPLTGGISAAAQPCSLTKVVKLAGNVTIPSSGPRQPLYALEIPCTPAVPPYKSWEHVTTNVYNPAEVRRCTLFFLLYLTPAVHSSQLRPLLPGWPLDTSYGKEKRPARIFVKPRDSSGCVGQLRSCWAPGHLLMAARNRRCTASALLQRRRAETRGGELPRTSLCMPASRRHAAALHAG